MFHSKSLDLPTITKEKSLPHTKAPIADLVRPWDLKPDGETYKDNLANDLFLVGHQEPTSGNYIELTKKKTPIILGNKSILPNKDTSATALKNNHKTINNNSGKKRESKNYGVSEKHCSISFDQDSCAYSITDLNTVCGTWLSVCHEGGVTLAPGQTINFFGTYVRVFEGPGFSDGIEALYEFIRCHSLESSWDSLIKCFQTLCLPLTLHTLYHSAIPLFHHLCSDDDFPVEHLALLWAALQDSSEYFIPVEQKSKSLMLLDTEDNTLATIRWAGAYLSLCHHKNGTETSAEQKNPGEPTQKTIEKREKTVSDANPTFLKASHNNRINTDEMLINSQCSKLNKAQNRLETHTEFEKTKKSFSKKNNFMKLFVESSAEQIQNAVQYYYKSFGNEETSCADFSSDKLQKNDYCFNEIIFGSSQTEQRLTKKNQDKRNLKKNDYKPLITIEPDLFQNTELRKQNLTQDMIQSPVDTAISKVKCCIEPTTIIVSTENVGEQNNNADNNGQIMSNMCCEEAYSHSCFEKIKMQATAAANIFDIFFNQDKPDSNKNIKELHPNAQKEKTQDNVKVYSSNFVLSSIYSSPLADSQLQMFDFTVPRWSAPSRSNRRHQWPLTHNNGSYWKHHSPVSVKGKREANNDITIQNSQFYYNKKAEPTFSGTAAEICSGIVYSKSLELNTGNNKWINERQELVSSKSLPLNLIESNSIVSVISKKKNIGKKKYGTAVYSQGDDYGVYVNDSFLVRSSNNEGYHFHWKLSTKCSSDKQIRKLIAASSGKQGSSVFASTPQLHMFKKIKNKDQLFLQRRALPNKWNSANLKRKNYGGVSKSRRRLTFRGNPKLGFISAYRPVFTGKVSNEFLKNQWTNSDVLYFGSMVDFGASKKKSSGNSWFKITQDQFRKHWSLCVASEKELCSCFYDILKLPKNNNFQNIELQLNVQAAAPKMLCSSNEIVTDEDKTTQDLLFNKCLLKEHMSFCKSHKNKQLLEDTGDTVSDSSVEYDYAEKVREELSNRLWLSMSKKLNEMFYSSGELEHEEKRSCLIHYNNKLESFNNLTNILQDVSAMQYLISYVHVWLTRQQKQSRNSSNNGDQLESFDSRNLFNAQYPFDMLRHLVLSSNLPSFPVGDSKLCQNPINPEELSLASNPSQLYYLNGQYCPDIVFSRNSTKLINEEPPIGLRCNSVPFPIPSFENRNCMFRFSDTILLPRVSDLLHNEAQRAKTRNTKEFGFSDTKSSLSACCSSNKFSFNTLLARAKNWFNVQRDFDLALETKENEDTAEWLPFTANLGNATCRQLICIRHGCSDQHEADDMLFVISYWNGRFKLWVFDKTFPENGSRLEDSSGKSLNASFSKSTDVFVKLKPFKSHIIFPGDVLKLGHLTFSVVRFRTGIAALQGCRPTMEDEAISIQHLFGITQDPSIYCSYFAVYDGHGGRACADYVHKHLHKMFTRQIALLAPRKLSKSECGQRVVYTSIYRAFVLLDWLFLKFQQECNEGMNGPGCATAVVIVLGDYLWAANCGDVRVVLSREKKALDLTSDHKPTRRDECIRIEESGAFVRYRRILGRLAVSRSFGDLEYKNIGQYKPPYVIADPEIRMERIQRSTDEFLLVACDGLFDVLSSQQAIDFVQKRLDSSTDRNPQKIAKSLVRHAVETKGSKDNVSAIVVLL